MGQHRTLGRWWSPGAPHPPCARHQETQQVPTEEVSLEVLLSNGQKVLVSVLTSDQTEDVLEVRGLFCTPPCSPGLRVQWCSGVGLSDQLYFLPSSQAVAAKLELPDDLIGYFSLFLVREKEDGAFSCESFRLSRPLR